MPKNTSEKMVNCHIPPHIQEDRTSFRRARPAKAEKPDSLLDYTAASKKVKRIHFGTGNVQMSAWVYQDENKWTISEKEIKPADKITMTFKRLSHEMWLFLEGEFLEEVGEGRDKVATYNFSRLYMSVLRWLLESWNLPIPLKRTEDGQLTDATMEAVCKVHPHILGHFVNKYVDMLFLSDKEKEQIARQSALLFAPNGKGVNNACEAISMYCTLSGMWEKFGLNYFDLLRLPHEVFVQLRMVMSFEVDIRQSRSEGQNKKSNVTHGRGGRRKGVTTPYSRF